MSFEPWDDEPDDEPKRERLFPNREALRAFLEAHHKKLCEDCGCCEMTRRDCWNCGGEGYSSHDCGEDCCCCLDPEDNVVCHVCEGRGGFDVCIGCCNPGDED